MKKIAYLISAYTEPETLENLINSLDRNDVDFFVHIDKKVSISPFINLKKRNNVFLLPDNLRVKIYWGGYSQVLMQFNMIEYMFSKKILYKRIVSLTGTDYPLVSNDELIEFFCKENVEYIIGFDISNEEYRLGKRPPHQNRFLYYYHMDGSKYIRGLFNKLKIRKVKNYDDLSYNFYYGSEYWALSYDCLSKIISEFKKDKRFQKILKNSFCPSESWIHTIFFNSIFKEKGISYNDYEHRELHCLAPLTYFEYRGAVKVLTLQDKDKIFNSNKKFARKLILGKSDELIDYINCLRNN